MRFQRITQWVGIATIVAAGGCNDLNVENPNAPDAKRALADPNAVEAVGAGAMRTWFNSFNQLAAAGVMSVQARTFSASWNNANMNFYSSIDNSTAAPDQWNRMTRSWQNDPSAAGRTSVEAYWGGTIDQVAVFRGGFYSSLSSANDALTAIRTNDVVIRTPEDTKRLETIATFMQGASLMMLALDFDKAYIVDDKTDLTTLEYSNRKQVRDAAIAKLQEAITLAKANTFTTPAAWTNGKSYTNLQIAQIANTMAAMTLAYYPRDVTEVAAVSWSQVASFAAQGMSAGTPVDFWLVGDGQVSWSHELLAWFGEIDSGRLQTRVSHLLDPATQKDPWPAAAGGNPQPNSLDKRLGDGSFGNASTQGSFKTVPKTGKAGTDFAWTANGQAMRPDRGQYHQSNLAYIRYDESGTQDPQGQYNGYGPLPGISRNLNDLLWAEALLRQGASGAAQAATLIDKTRVVRGGLSSAAGFVGNIGSDADGPCMSTGVKAKDGTPCSLWSVLLYEKELELLGQGAVPFFEQRRLPVITGGGFAGDNSPRRVIAGLLPGTPREMPVPAKELGVKGEALYTWGGTTPKSVAP
jgi:starch-binding outer membrane protein, SusD/RagB family